MKKLVHNFLHVYIHYIEEKTIQIYLLFVDLCAFLQTYLFHDHIVLVFVSKTLRKIYAVKRVALSDQNTESADGGGCLNSLTDWDLR